MSISPWSGAKGLEKLASLKYYSVVKQYFKHVNLLRPLAPSQGEIGISAQGLFCTKFNSKQLLLEAFFDAMHIFGSIGP